ncbi:uncharacterized protein [Palaemon carinicauda]|uniref:uncharacterized protein n=1 Tax=Palaemon carinicauda TaxID=392227 RepID=UPI0035B59827
MAYNPAANGIVECFHLTFKSVLMSCCKDSNCFTQILWVFMRLRITPKDTLHVSVAEMLYSDPLVVPDELFPTTTSPNNYLSLCYIVGIFTPCQQPYKLTAKQHISADLHIVSHLLLHNDTSKRPLMFPYTGPFLLIRQTTKVFLLNIHDKESWCSIDSLKSGYTAR